MTQIELFLTNLQPFLIGAGVIWWVVNKTLDNGKVKWV